MRDHMPMTIATQGQPWQVLAQAMPADHARLGPSAPRPRLTGPSASPAPGLPLGAPGLLGPTPRVPAMPCPAIRRATRLFGAQAPALRSTRGTFGAPQQPSGLSHSGITTPAVSGRARRGPRPGGSPTGSGPGGWPQARGTWRRRPACPRPRPWTGASPSPRRLRRKEGARL